MLVMNTVELVKLIETVLELEHGALSEETSAEQVEKWDSLGHLGILVALDTRCDGKVASISGMATAHSIPDIIQLLLENSLLTK